MSLQPKQAENAAEFANREGGNFPVVGGGYSPVAGNEVTGTVHELTESRRLYFCVAALNNQRTFRGAAWTA